MTLHGLDALAREAMAAAERAASAEREGRSAWIIALHRTDAFELLAELEREAAQPRDDLRAAGIL